MISLIVGMGEVGKALYEVLSPHGMVYCKDLAPVEIPQCDIMHVCIRHSSDFLPIVKDYADRYSPRLVNICSTVPPGTTEQLRLLDAQACHSTTRGLHPNLAKGLRTIKKHIGGPCAEEVADYFRKAGVPCVTHRQAKTTELAHLLNNISYAVNVAFADEMAAICRQFGVDYQEAVIHYTQTNNEGFRQLDHDSKCRMILTPPGGKIGGHCLVQAANMLKAAGAKGDGLDMVAKYGIDPPPAIVPSLERFRTTAVIESSGIKNGNGTHKEFAK